ncbi:hypothetical protein CHS0354_020773 [Potamilus streckersoni]|uniref:Protein DPCD n=1 Tax=Potamilus streckersoni TaxID=2493646 RepID=A0AAE0VSY0_9BIVA|nr:hypothetical protein CHS0354_020773 [Potamilus streckersoni]
MASMWVENLRNAQKTCLVQNGRRKIHFTLSDGTELAEEYDLRNDELVVRKWRRKGTIGGIGKWEFEVGEELMVRNLESEGLIETSSNPIFIRKDTKTAFQWRVRNLPYPKETYILSIDDDQQNIIIRTTNKKYYKKFGIPDMNRIQLALEPQNLSFAYANNTLIVSYQKPEPILEIEKLLQEEFRKLKASKDGDVDCTPS